MFKSNTPTMIRIIANMLIKLTLSLKMMTETIVVRTNPNPDHVAYETFSGKYFRAIPKK